MTDAEALKKRLDDEWNAVPSSMVDAIEGGRLGRQDGFDIVFGISSEGNRHLLIELGPAEDIAFTSLAWDGLVVNLTTLGAKGIDSSQWVDLECTDNVYERTFRALCRDVLDRLPLDATSSIDAVVRVLTDWARFWKQPPSLSRSSEIGLIGELLFLRDWLLPLHGDNAVSMWTGPSGLVHDFSSPSMSVEVKTASGYASAPAHTIQSLEQLTPPATGRLYLLSFQIFEDTLGALNLGGMTREISQSLAPGAQGLFEESLARISLPLELPDTNWRLVRSGLYEVDETFPKITRESLQGIDRDAIPNLSYLLEMSACSPWLREEGPSGASVVASMG